MIDWSGYDKYTISMEEYLQSWMENIKLIYSTEPCGIPYITEWFLQTVGMTDVVKRDDGKFDATLNGKRFIGLYPISEDNKELGYETSNSIRYTYGI